MILTSTLLRFTSEWSTQCFKERGRARRLYDDKKLQITRGLENCGVKNYFNTFFVITSMVGGPIELGPQGEKVIDLLRS